MMATLKAPLLSLDARGQIGKAIVYSGWKGLKTARQHVTPANPRTAAQVTQRGYMADAVFAWKNYFVLAEARAAWNRWALDNSKPLSGFNGFTSNAVQLIPTDAASSMVTLMTEIAAALINFTMANLDDGTTGDEAGNFEIWTGPTASSLTLSEEIALVGGDLVGTVDQGDTGDIVYCKVRKDGFDRSGIEVATLLAP